MGKESKTLMDILAARQSALKIGEAAELLNFSATHLYSMVKSNRIPHFRVGYAIRLDPQRLAAWLAEREFLPLSMMAQSTGHTPKTAKRGKRR